MNQLLENLKISFYASSHPSAFSYVLLKAMQPVMAEQGLQYQALTLLLPYTFAAQVWPVGQQMVLAESCTPHLLNRNLQAE